MRNQKFADRGLRGPFGSRARGLLPIQKKTGAKTFIRRLKTDSPLISSSPGEISHKSVLQIHTISFSEQ